MIIYVNDVEREITLKGWNGCVEWYERSDDCPENDFEEFYCNMR